ncbi:MAG TPA: hypothetical protein VEO54_15510 [Thermoanaerobaculia bacterium]|nr:hypothetical protein [Thermoanaerobaculia bacterium]
MKMKRWMLALLVVVMAAGWSTSSFAIGNCIPDAYGHIECAKQCYYTNICYSNNFPRYYYCYVYDVPPFGCWHDGTYEECCVLKRTF